MNTVSHIRTNVLKVSQSAFAEAVGCAQASVSRWEAGQSSPTLDDIRAMRRAVEQAEKDWNDDWLFPADVPATPEVAA